ncbi:hypothetical protein [Halodesulfovibrio sp.]|jgi:hypothetical protein|uniref:hypothetical protein n=1 Tax=Halodesulfovibrio sp. TaxID=1912772 RepID=UPI0025D9328A|nr:hypothetical protein [Halodesulfovibrio sp.]MCT4536043.1 hypothetical protein [Halodesulfovibrio sp.]
MLAKNNNLVCNLIYVLKERQRKLLGVDKSVPIMNRTGIIAMIDLLRLSRKSLLEPTLSNEPTLMRGFFSYENDSELRTLFFEKQFVSWINGKILHFNDNQVLKNNVWGQQRFTHILGQLSRSRIQSLIKNSDSELLTFCSALLNEKVQLLEGLLIVGDNNITRLNKLLYQQEKDQVLFDRKFKELKEKTDGKIQ